MVNHLKAMHKAANVVVLLLHGEERLDEMP
jgi:hypothetical protein